MRNGPLRSTDGVPSAPSAHGHVLAAESQATLHTVYQHSRFDYTERLSEFRHAMCVFRGMVSGIGFMAIRDRTER